MNEQATQVTSMSILEAQIDTLRELTQVVATLAEKIAAMQDKIDELAAEHVNLKCHGG